MASFLDRVDPNLMFQLSAGLLGGKTAAEQSSGAMTGLSNYYTASQDKRKQLAQTNKTLEYLRSVSPELAAQVDAGLPAADAFKMYNDQRLKAQMPKKRNLTSVGGLIYDEDTGQWITPPAGAGSTEYGLTPQTGVDANGNPVLIQVGKGGTAVQTKMPEGVTLSKTPIKLDAGTHFVLLDPITRQPVGQIPKDVAGAEREKQGGKAQAEAQVQLGGAKQIASQIDQQINDLKADPSLGSVLGPIDSRTPNIFPGAVRAQDRIDQIKGGAFLQARQMLKGGGAITDYEGQKAEKAFARMSQAQSEQDFKIALDEFNAAVQEGVRKLEAVAMGGGSQPSQGGNDIDALIEQYGGQ